MCMWYLTLSKCILVMMQTQKGMLTRAFWIEYVAIWLNMWYIGKSTIQSLDFFKNGLSALFINLICCDHHLVAQWIESTW